MNRLRRSAMLAIVACLAVSVVDAQGRGRGGARGGGARGRQGGAPGGQWSQRSHGGRQTPGGLGQSRGGEGARGAGANRNRSGAAGSSNASSAAAARNRRSPNNAGGDAAAGAAAANRRSPNTSGAADAAAGAAAANRNQPTAAQGAAAGAAAANRNQPNLSGAADYASVRNSFNNPNMYNEGWYGDHPGAWAATGWAAGTAWQPTTWAAVAGHCGYAVAAPISYDYGVNVVSQDGNVMVNGQSVGTNEEYSQQAADLAAAGTAAPAADTDQWLPLGVFGMVKDANQHAHLIVQLAVNQQGTLRGNYTDELTDHTLPIHGAVDKTTQRAAWSVGGNTSTVMEAGLNDLTQNEAPALIHKNGQTDHWILVRLEQPAAAPEAPATPDAAADPAATP